MKKILKYILLITLCISLGVYFYTMFFTNYSSTSKKEIEFVYLLVFPCLAIYIYSLCDNYTEDKKWYLKLYLLTYIIILLGFAFSENRGTTAISYGLIDDNNNFIPFFSISKMLNSPLGIKFGLYNIIGNFLMLTPLSFLLPLAFDKFSNKKIFAFFIVLLSVFIETIQLLTKAGSFDIDDIILNTMGSILFFFIFNFTIIKKLLIFCFFELKISNWICIIASSIFIIIGYFLLIIHIYNVVEYTNAEKVKIYNAKCLKNEKTYIATLENYDYFTSCKYKNIIIKKGNNSYSLKEAIENVGLEKEINKKIKLTKEKLISNIHVIDGKQSKELIYSENEFKNYTYLYGIKDIKFRYKDRDTNIRDALNSKLITINNITSLTKPYKKYNDYAVSKGKYFDLLNCNMGYNDLNKVKNEYIIQKKFRNYEMLCESD